MKISIEQLEIMEAASMDTLNEHKCNSTQYQMKFHIVSGILLTCGQRLSPSMAGKAVPKCPPLCKW